MPAYVTLHGNGFRRSDPQNRVSADLYGVIESASTSRFEAGGRRMHRTVLLAIAVATTLSGCKGLSGLDRANASAWSDVRNVRNPATLPAQKPAERVAVGLTGDYKPDLVILPSGEMLLVMFQPVTNPNGTYQENMIMYRSEDGGQTWGTRDTLPLLGREPYFTLLSDGTLFITASFLSVDYRNTEGYTYAIVYRSRDGGATWTSMAILSQDVPNVPPRTETVTSRNLIQLSDGTLLLGVGAGTSADYLWRSQDEGVTWDKTQQVQAPAGYDEAANGIPWLEEFWFTLAPNGDLLGFQRGYAQALPPLPGTEYPANSATDDNTNLLSVFRSHDSGVTWTLDPPLGTTYGEMYPSLLHLSDTSVLFTYTVRELQPQLGVQAVLGTPTSTGFALNFKTDVLLLDAETPANETSGGGFGNTVRVADGTLITAYSYRGSDGNTHVEVVRWNLPT
jgi:hypothetical protein